MFLEFLLVYSLTAKKTPANYDPNYKNCIHIGNRFFRIWLANITYQTIFRKPKKATTKKKPFTRQKNGQVVFQFDVRTKRRVEEMLQGINQGFKVKILLYKILILQFKLLPRNGN